ncbi:hypothetical protein ColTof3_14539 [Colletotrichum tofieldiae]|nr:hypothetical protein ColTof3_14539 [Colletotrichum tofieldiae]
MHQDYSQGFKSFTTEVNQNQWSEDDLLISKIKTCEKLEELNRSIAAWYDKQGNKEPIQAKYHMIGYLYYVMVMSQSPQGKQRLSENLRNYMDMMQLPESRAQAVKAKRRFPMQRTCYPIATPQQLLWIKVRTVSLLIGGLR